MGARRPRRWCRAAAGRPCRGGGATSRARLGGVLEGGAAGRGSARDGRPLGVRGGRGSECRAGGVDEGDGAEAGGSRRGRRRLTSPGLLVMCNFAFVHLWCPTTAYRRTGHRLPRRAAPVPGVSRPCRGYGVGWGLAGGPPRMGGGSHAVDGSAPCLLSPRVVVFCALGRPTLPAATRSASREGRQGGDGRRTCLPAGATGRPRVPPPFCSGRPLL